MKVKIDYVVILFLFIVFLGTFSVENRAFKIVKKNKIELFKDGVNKVEKVPSYYSRIKEELEKTKIITNDSIVQDTIQKINK